MTQKAAIPDTEVLIVGGGLVGMTLAVTLGGAGVPVVLVDRDEPAAQQAAAFDGRASAIARGSMQALEAAGLWSGMAATAQPIEEIRVSDGRVGRPASALFLHYGHADLDGQPLGYMVENRVTRRALAERLAALDRVTWLAPATVTAVARGPVWSEATLEDGRRIRARLVAAADGKDSPLRAAAGIRHVAWDYPQMGIVTTVAHERPHNGVAHECFLPSGPFAMLPLTDGPFPEATSPKAHRSSLVWTERRDLAPTMLALDDADFARELERRFGDSLGRLRVAGKRWCYPLSLTLAISAVAPRLALIGDAAHAIHPIAGQGLNLGLRDVAALAEVLVDARRLGLDPGAAGVLRRYARWRRVDNLMLIAVTDGLNRLFSNDVAPLRLLRDLGLAAVDRMPPAKRFFMRHAMGLVGSLPRLIEGRPL